jgi:class 3 adenylate cyclase
MKDESDEVKSRTSNLTPRTSEPSRIPHPSSFDSGRELLNSLLSELNQYPARGDKIAKQICDTFERRVAILALDMVGFSRLTIEYGIIHYLAMIHQMAQGAIPAVKANGGKVIKLEADNLFAIFDKPAQALEASFDIFRAFNAINSVVPTERDIFGSIGIGYGETLIIDDKDLFGSEMNLACKLGEDLAEKNDILLTPAAFTALPARRYICEPVSFSLNDLEIHCYRYERRHHPKANRK